MAIASPRQAVFETAEILEQILSYQPVATLRACQRVCKQFQAIVQASPILQEEMILRPRAGPRPCWRLESRGYMMDPFNQARFVLHEGEIPAQSPEGPWDFSRSAIVKTSFWTPARLCPLLAVNNGWHPVARQHSAFRLQGQQGAYVRFGCSEHIMSTLGSWKNVLVTDPPCFEADVSLKFVVGHYGIPDGTMRLKRKVKNLDGLRFSDLIMGALEMPGQVSWSLNGRSYNREYKRPDVVLKRMEERLGVKAILDVGREQAASYTRAFLSGMAIPAEEEWSTVKLAPGNQAE